MVLLLCQDRDWWIDCRMLTMAEDEGVAHILIHQIKDILIWICRRKHVYAVGSNDAHYLL